MKMTNRLADAMMNDLACVAISANGGVAIDENGDPFMTEEQMQKVNEYARNTFVNILTEWEDFMGESWEIEEEEEEDEE